MLTSHNEIVQSPPYVSDSNHYHQAETGDPSKLIWFTISKSIVFGEWQAFMARRSKVPVWISARDEWLRDQTFILKEPAHLFWHGWELYRAYINALLLLARSSSSLLDHKCCWLLLVARYILFTWWQLKWVFSLTLRYDVTAMSWLLCSSESRVCRIMS
jgi:hypothetical protein